MLPLPGASVHSFAPGGSLPVELDSLVDFVADDDRPTFILDHATTKILYRNNAFDALITTSTSPPWLTSLLEAACHGTRPHPRTTEPLATFADRSWSRKSIGASWTAVSCHGQAQQSPFDGAVQGTRDPSPSRVASPTGGIPDLPTTRQGFGPALPIDVSPLKRQESDTGSIASASTNSWSFASSDADTPFEHLEVDWLLSPRPSPDAWFDLLYNHNWQDKAVGPIHSWPTMLRQMYTTILASEEPRILYWGNEMLMLYNEKARFVTGEMHPATLGEPLINAWGESVHTEIVRMVRAGVKRGKPVCQKDHEFILPRYGFAESCFFDVVLLPIPSPDGHYLGILTEFTEVTEKVLQRNRSEVSRSLLKNISKAIDLRNLWQVFAQTLRANSRDISYAAVYTINTSLLEHSADTFKLEASCNIEGLETHPSPAIVAALRRSTNEVIALQRTKDTLPPELAVSVPEIGIVETAYVLPIVALDGVRLLGVVVLGLNPRRAMNPSVRQFIESVRDMLFKSAALFSLPMEQRESNEISQALTQQLETMTLKAEASEQNFTKMLRDAPIGMCMHREDGHCVYVNDVCLQLLGMSKVEFHKAAEVGLAWRDAVRDEDLDIVNQIWTSAIEKGTAASAEFRVKAVFSPEDRWLEISAQQRHDREGNLEYVYVWFRDISTRKQLAEQKLQDALETKRRSEVFIDMYGSHWIERCDSKFADVVQDKPRDAQSSGSNPVTCGWYPDFAASGNQCFDPRSPTYAVGYCS
jgi:PAS domain S-box-containing protein